MLIATPLDNSRRWKRTSVQILGHLHPPLEAP